MEPEKQKQNQIQKQTEYQINQNQIQKQTDQKNQKEQREKEQKEKEQKQKTPENPENPESTETPFQELLSLLKSMPFPKSLSDIKRYMKDPLYENSFYLMLSSIVGSGAGFIFWMLAAKLYPPSAVGLATAMISSLSLIILISRLGLDISLIRFFPENDKSKIFNTTLIVTTVTALVIAVIYLAGIEFWTPKLQELKETRNILFFLTFVAAYSIISVTGVTFTASRKAKYQFYQNILMASRIIFILFFIFLGAIGIFASFGTAALLTITFALVIVIAKIGVRLSATISSDYLKETFKFSTGNYLTNLMIVSPNLLIPIMILNLLGSEATAYFYIAFTMANVLNIIPNATSTSLLVEGSHGEPLKKSVFKALYGIYVLLIPGILIFFILGGVFLNYLGKEYSSQGFTLLRLFVISTVFTTPVLIFYSIKRIQKDVKGLLSITTLFFVTLISLTYILIKKIGILGAGYSWLGTYILLTIIIIIEIKRSGWT